MALQMFLDSNLHLLRLLVVLAEAHGSWSLEGHSFRNPAVTVAKTATPLNGELEGFFFFFWKPMLAISHGNISVYLS